MLQRLRKFVHLHHIWIHQIFPVLYPCHFIAPLLILFFYFPDKQKKASGISSELTFVLSTLILL